MTNVRVNASNVDDTDCNIAIIDVAPGVDVQSVIWRAARLLDAGGKITAMVDYEDVREYASLADVPRPVLRVYWRVEARRPQGNDVAVGYHDTIGAAKKSARAWRKVKRIVTVTRMVVRPRGAR